jgi:uncharacterized protein (TIGR04255 family)
MGYRNPPVIEVGMFFDFYPSDETPQWDEKSAKIFFQHKDIEKEFFNIEEFYQQQFRVEPDFQNKTALATASTSFLREVLARDESSSKILSVNENRLIYRIGRKNNEFPRYGTATQSIFGILSVYKEVWKPERIKNVSLSYVDVIKIPEQQAELGEYFLLGVSFPNELGISGFMEGRVVFSDENKYKDVTFRQIPTKNKEIAFQFFWTARCQLDVTAQSEDAIKNAMEELHRKLKESFELSFTDKCKSLFNPF